MTSIGADFGAQVVQTGPTNEAEVIKKRDLCQEVRHQFRLLFATLYPHLAPNGSHEWSESGVRKRYKKQPDF